MAKSMEFPESPEAVTANWMTRALVDAFPGAEVSGLRVLDQHSGTTGRIRVGLTYSSSVVGPESVFVKLPPFDESQRQLVAMTDMGRTEARFYDGPATETPIRVPKAYFAAHGEDRAQYVVVLEDLEASGCFFANRLEPLTDDQGEQLMGGLAGLHAHFWDDARFSDELSWVMPPMRGELGARLIEKAREKFADEFGPVFEELCRLYSDNHEAICDVWDDGPKTLIHGDCHTGNQFLDGDDVGLYDWAVLSRSPGIRDVAIYLGNSCPTELRRANQDRWLRVYHGALVAAGVDAPSIDDLWHAYRRTVLYGWVAATTTASMGDTWQPIEVGMAGMARATQACADLDTVDTLREVL